MLRTAAAACVAFAVVWSSALASPLPALKKNERWLAVASSRDVDTAIGIAQYYGWKGARVVSSKSGWYGVVLGPFAATTREQLLKLEPNLTDLPPDALFSAGGNYTDVVFTTPPAAGDGPLSGYGTEKPGHFSTGALSVEVRLTGDENNPGPTEIKGILNNAPAFSFSTSDEYSSQNASAGLLKLDPATPLPQVVVTRFTGGAHCCTKTWIATQAQNAAAWTLVEGATLDGGGYAYEDLDGDGALELISADNRFLYAFSSYAESFAPQRYFQLRGASLQDVTATPAFLPQVKRDLAYKEFSAELTPEVAKSPGYLAAWVALKILAGEGDAAWTKMLSGYEQQNDFGPKECTSGQKVEDCPSENLKSIPFPKALAQFLLDGNYTPLPAAAQKLLN